MSINEVAADQSKPAVMTLGADLSPAVKAIENAYRQIQRRHKDAPNVTIVVKRDARAWGHTTVAHVWAPNGVDKADRLEIMISGENLSRGAQAVAATLLHEAAHAANLANGILDTDVNGRHNKTFKSKAESFGLTVEQVGRHGWTATELSDESAKQWKGMIKTIADGLAKSAKAAHPALVVTGGADGAKPTAGTALGPRRRTGNRNLIKAECACGASIRLSQKVLDQCAPTCSECEQPFTPAA